MTFPFIQKGVAEESLTLHGLWNDIASGALESFDGATQRFVEI
jgi:carbonic anhydrase